MKVRRAAIVGLPLAWVAHDAEEMLGAERWSRKAPDLIRGRFPHAPEWLLRRIPVTTAQMAVAISAVGTFVIMATIPALRRHGSKFGPFRIALAGYRLHGFTHLGQSLVLRSYTPGVATVPVFVLGYSAWAWTQLRDAGLGGVA